MPEYGPKYLPSLLGILKLTEILVSVIMIIFMKAQFRKDYIYSYSNYYDPLFSAAVVCLVFSLIVLIICCFNWANDIEVVLKWMFLLWILFAIWTIVVGVLYILENPYVYLLIAAILAIVLGIVYVIDAIYSIKKYKPC